MLPAANLRASEREAWQVWLVRAGQMGGRRPGRGEKGMQRGQVRESGDGKVVPGKGGFREGELPPAPQLREAELSEKRGQVAWVVPGPGPCGLWFRGTGKEGLEDTCCTLVWRGSEGDVPRQFGGEGGHLLRPWSVVAGLLSSAPDS